MAGIPKRFRASMLFGASLVCVAVLVAAVARRLISNSRSAGGHESASAFLISPAIPLPNESSSNKLEEILAEAAESFVHLREGGSQDGMAGDSPCDEEWLAFPRSGFSIGWYFSLLPESIDGSTLFRHTQLNPGDIPLPSGLRKEFDEMLRKLVAPQLKAFNRAQSTIAMRDIETAGSALKWEPVITENRKVKYKDGTTREEPFISLSGPGSQRIYGFNSNGQPVAIGPEQLPGFMRAKEMRSFLIVELGHAIVDWFEAVGACPPAEASKVRAEIVEWS